MSRFKRNIAPPASASLFPFLSLLACVIGVLALMIGMLAPTQAEGPPRVDDPQLAAQLGKLNEQLEFTKLDIARLNQRRVEAEAIHSQLARSEKELNGFRTQNNERERKKKEIADLKARLRGEMASLATKAAELEPELPELDRQSAGLKAQIDERKKPPPEPVVIVNSYGPRPPVAPAFVECRSDGIVIHDSGEPTLVKPAELATNKTYLDLLQCTAATPDGAIVFLVRSDGIATYSSARNIAIQKGCRHGKIPIVGGGPIDLSRVKVDTDEESKVEESKEGER